MASRIRTEPGGLPDLKQIARQLLARTRHGDRSLEELAEHAADVVVRVNRDERVLYINLTGERIYGRPRSAIVGKTLSELSLPRETTKQLRDGIELALSTGTTISPILDLAVRGETLHFQSIFTPEPRNANRPASLLLLARDVSDKLRAEEARRMLVAERRARSDAEDALRRSVLLNEVASLLATCLVPAEAFQKLAELLVSRVADLCVIDMVEMDGSLNRVAAAHALASKSSLARELAEKFPPRLPHRPSVHEVLASRTPHLYSPISDAQLATCAQNEEHLRILRALRPQSSVIIPLICRGRPVGSLGLSITLDDMAFMVELGRQIAIAAEHAELRSQAQATQLASERAAHRAKKLLDMTLAISDATSIPEIARRTLEQIGAALHPTSASIHTLGSNGASLELLDAIDFGLAASPIERPTSIALEAPLPLAHAVSRRELLWVDDADLATLFPTARGELPSAGALACLPLEIEDRTLGGLTVTFKKTRPDSSEEFDFLQIASRTAAQAIARAQSMAAEKRAREAAERAARTIARQNQITHELTRALTSEDVAVTLVRELMSALSASGCAVAEIDGDTLRVLMSAGAETEALSSRARVPLLDDDPLAVAARRGEPVGPARAPGSNASAAGARGATPLITSVGPVGAVSLSFRRERALDPDERTFLSTVARVGAHALERTRLFHQIEKAEHKLSTIVRTAPVAIMVFDFDGSVRAWNPAAEALFGWPAEEAIGRFMPAVPEERRAEFLGYLDALARGEEFAGREMLRRRKGGDLIPVAVWWARLDNKDGSTQCLAIAKEIASDIPEGAVEGRGSRGAGA
ncbi:MAG: PAS domain S-box protein [Polyangiaceae bacterium]|nr:PAS domain S-box protein [Polyangiaceae bacterium]